LIIFIFKNVSLQTLLLNTCILFLHFNYQTDNNTAAGLTCIFDSCSSLSFLPLWSWSYFHPERSSTS